MPQLLERLVQQLMDKGHSKSEAYAIATAQLQKSGSLNKHAELTNKGAKRQAMGAEGRAKDRASKASGGRHKPSDYGYSKRTNQSTLRKGK